MGSTIYTRKGDDGTTSLVGGQRLKKNSARVEAYGTIDECSSFVGAARSECEKPLLSSALEFFQQRLFNCASVLATSPDDRPLAPPITEEDVTFLEKAIDRFEETGGPQTRFILPGGGRGGSRLHVAGTVCRRAERRILAAHDAKPVDPIIRKFINRGSDMLFAAARYANAIEGVTETAWDKAFKPPSL